MNKYDPITAGEFTRRGQAIVGAVGWQSKLAREMRVNARTVRRYVKDGVPAKAAGPVRRMLELLETGT